MKETIQKKEELTRAYYRFSKAWYATDRDLAKPTIMIGLYHPDDGTAGEISIEWEDIKGQKVPKLSAYDDGWKALSSFNNLLREMAGWDNKNITEEQFVQLLDKTGFTDLTPYTQNLKHSQQPRIVSPDKNKGLKK